MGFQVSAGVAIQETDLTTVVPAVSTTEGAIGGVFRWGPVEERVLVDSEERLVERFGKPTNYNAETFFTAANFLAYGNKLYVSRGADANTISAIANTDTVADVAAQSVKNNDAYDGITFDANVQHVARWPGELGNSIKISVCDSATAYSQTVNMIDPADVTNDIAETYLKFTPGSKTAEFRMHSSVSDFVTSNLDDPIIQAFSVGDFINVNGQKMQIASIASMSYATLGGPEYEATTTFTFKQTYNNVEELSIQQVERLWEYWNVFDRAPGTSWYLDSLDLTEQDELHIVVADEDGLFTGVSGTVLEVFSSLSRATDAKTEAGAGNYYKDVIKQSSNYIWNVNDRSGAASALSSAVITSTNDVPQNMSFVGGADGAGEGTVALSALTAAYDLFKDDVDISLILAGKARGGTTMAGYIISNICEVRKDCMVWISPEYNDVINTSTAMDNVIDFRNSVTNNSSYAVLDSGYKYQYDKYNDVNRYVPLNGDIAGTAVRTDVERDAWWSPAGFNRGQIKNVIKLAYNPSKAERDQLYQADVNPVVSFPGEGTVLYGDKTLLGRPSAFDRINVRRLFIVLEKAIAVAARSFLFEFNDAATRARFKSMVEPFLRDVQGRRGIYDFKVVVDETNNTGEVIDRNEFVGDIFIKPARSINFINLNFVAVRTGVEFDEIVGTV